jgi:hypothetical protein
MTNLVETDIHWVLTVPAIWKDNGQKKKKKKANNDLQKRYTDK